MLELQYGWKHSRITVTVYVRYKGGSKNIPFPLQYGDGHVKKERTMWAIQTN